MTEANNHGEDCGQAGLQMSLSARQQAHYTVLGIGQNVAQAFTPYRITLHGQKVAIIAATQVIDADLQTAWTATASQPGLASAYDVSDLVAAVEAARRVSDTVIVFLHWGTELDACPNPEQEPLANLLVGPEPTSSSAAMPTSCSGAATWARPTSTTASAISPSTTIHPRPTRADRWSSPSPAVIWTTSPGGRR